MGDRHPCCHLYALRVPEAVTSRRIGVYGGTFDPPHAGHLHVATHAATELALDRVLLVVANDPWQKSHRVEAGAADRLAMTEHLVAGHPALEASAIEIDRGGQTYAVDTLEEVRRRFEGARPVLILGADAAANIETWHRADELGGLCDFAVAARSGAAVGDEFPWPVTMLSAPVLDVSSTEIRAALRDGQPPSELVPPGVASFIEAAGLYGVGDD